MESYRTKVEVVENGLKLSQIKHGSYILGLVVSNIEIKIYVSYLSVNSRPIL